MKWVRPTAIISDRPIADHTEKRPPTQSQKRNTRESAMPNLDVSERLVETAANCRVTAVSPKAAFSHARADCAFIMVSMVVKVLEETMNSVRAGLRLFSVSARCAPSTFEMKCVAMVSCAKGDSACAAMAGPRSDPPMPILTTAVKGLPSAAVMRPWRMSSAKDRQRSRS